MIDFRKKKFLDEIFSQYRDTTEKTMETQDIIGHNNYMYFIDRVGEFMKEDVKSVKKANKKYEKFKSKALSIVLKMQRLNFAGFYVGIGWVIHKPEISIEELELMTYFEMCRHLRTIKTFYRLKRKIDRLIERFIDVLPEEWYATGNNEEIAPLEASEDNVNEVKTNSGAPDENTVLLASDCVSEETQSDKEKTGEIIEETPKGVSERERQEQILEAIIGNDDCEENESEAEE